VTPLIFFQKHTILSLIYPTLLLKYRLKIGWSLPVGCVWLLTFLISKSKLNKDSKVSFLIILVLNAKKPALKPNLLS